MTPLQHEAASTDVQLCLSYCELGYMSRLTALLPLVRTGSNALYGRLSLIAHSEFWDDFDILTNLEQGVRKVVIEVQLRSCSCSNVFISSPNVVVISVTSPTRGQMYITEPSRSTDIDPSRAMTMPTSQIFAYNFSAMLCSAQIDAKTWNSARCGMCALVLCAFRECAGSDVVDGFAHDHFSDCIQIVSFASFILVNLK